MIALVANLLGVRPPDQAVHQWHTSARVDVIAYAFSWAWVLIPLYFLGDRIPTDYLMIYLLVLSVTDVHRHYGLPYVYMDKQVFGRHPVRFVLFPLVMLVLWVASPLLVRARHMFSLVEITSGLGFVMAMITVLNRDRHDASLRGRDLGIAFVWLTAGVLGGTVATASLGESVPTFAARPTLEVIAVFAGIWNIWHVYNQKYGILRLYNAKSGVESKIPGWVDRALVWGWLPLYFFFLAPRYTEYALQRFARGKNVLRPLFESFTSASAVLLWPSVALVAFTVAAFAYYEWKCHRFRNAPRLWMMIGTTGLASSFLWIHPAKAYLAYAFSHAIEYMVFVWAFQRRRYERPLEHKPLLGRILKHPATAYLVFTLGLAAAFLYFKYYGRTIFPKGTRPRAFGFTTTEWIAYWTVYQSMVHFYYDGFLWKMRLPLVRANI